MQRKKTLSEEQYSSDSRKSHYFCCCCCRTNSREEIKSKGLNTPTDRYEYIIEKLAIKRVPLSSFATEEDLIGSEVSSMSYIRKAKIHDDPSRRPNIAFSSYAASVSPSSSKHFTQIASGKFEDQTNKRMAKQEPRYAPQEQIESTGNPHLDFMSMMGKMAGQHVQRRAKFLEEPKKTVQEKEMVSHILHNISSLYTLDEKEAIPKDPETFRNSEKRAARAKPIAKQIMPQIPINIFKPQKKLVYAQVHKTTKNVVETKPGMTQEIRDTINALGSAQPPLKNMNPKPKVRLKRPPTIEPEEERPDSFNELVEEESRELRCIALDKDVDLVLHNCCDEPRYHHDRPHEPPPRAILPKQQSPTQFVPQRNPRQPVHRLPPRVMNLIPMKNSFDIDSLEDIQEAESLPRVLEEESNVAVLPSQFSFGDVCTSTENSRKQEYQRPSNKLFPPKVNMSQLNNHCSDDPIMEINHVKGQNLKWKIIIKHHDDEEDTN